jgi:hypothetical protein
MVTLMLIVSLVLAPALTILMVRSVRSLRTPALARVDVGDPIVYRKLKVSTHPGARARQIHPAEHGDYYSYLVNKYWTVSDVLGDGRIVARTRTNKCHYISPDDPNLRKARLTERLRFGHRFPKLPDAAS